jgi:hypothetical protein
VAGRSEQPTLEEAAKRLERIAAGLERVAGELARVPRADDVLDVVAVKARYRFADDRAARAVMNEAGGFKVGGRLFARRIDLERLEAERVRRPAPPALRRTAGRPSRSPSTTSGPLEPGFWKP